MTSALSFKEQVSALSLAVQNPHVDIEKVEDRIHALMTRALPADPDYPNLIACRDRAAGLRERNLTVVSAQSTSCLWKIATVFWNALSYLFNTFYSYLCCAQPSAQTPVQAPVAQPSPAPLPPPVVGPKQPHHNPRTPDYRALRAAAPDGNCFYTSYTISFLEDFLVSGTKDTFIQTVRNLQLPDCPQEKESVLRTLEHLKESPTDAELLQTFLDNAAMTRFVKFFRCAAAYHIEQNRADLPLDTAFDLHIYCRRLRTMGTPTMDHYEIVHLSRAVGWGPRIIQPDGAVYNEGAIPFMSGGNTALYFSPHATKQEEAGHYDVLYTTIG